MYIYIYEIEREVSLVILSSPYQVNSVTGVQILDEGDCISHRGNTLEKGVNPIIFPPAMAEVSGRLGSLALVRQPV